MSGLLREPFKSFRVLVKNYCTKSPKTTPEPSVPLTRDVPGLSKKVLDVPKTEVGPGASKNAEYKNPEYFCYHNGSYFEAEVEMLKYRLPQPSSLSVEKK